MRPNKASWEQTSSTELACKHRTGSVPRQFIWSAGSPGLFGPAVEIAPQRFQPAPKRVAGFAVFDLAFPRAVNPHPIAVEIADDVPDLVGGLREDRGVIGVRHVRSSHRPLELTRRICRLRACEAHSISAMNRFAKRAARAAEANPCCT